MKTHILRLTPGQEIRREIQKYAAKYDIDAGFIITCVAGLNQLTMRMAGAEPKHQDIRTYHEKLEVVSLSGTVFQEDCHLHIAVSDIDGNVRGGHLKEAVVGVTAEIVLGEDESKLMTRELDPETGFDELIVSDKH